MFVPIYPQDPWGKLRENFAPYLGGMPLYTPIFKVFQVQV